MSAMQDPEQPSQVDPQSAQSAKPEEDDAKPPKMKPIVFSRPRFDAADFADERKSCCKLPLRWATLFWSAFFLVGGFVQLFEQIIQSEYSWGDIGRDLLTILAICMCLSGASGFVGAIFEIRYPVTFFALMLWIQIIIELCWFFLAEKESLSKTTAAPSAEKGNILTDMAHMLYHEILSGNRNGESGVAAHLFYTMFSITFHVVACESVASYALELRILGKTVWFEPIFEESDEEEEEATNEQAKLKALQEPSGYGAVEAGKAASPP